MTEVRRQKADDGEQMTEIIRQRTKGEKKTAIRTRNINYLYPLTLILLPINSINLVNMEPRTLNPEP